MRTSDLHLFNVPDLTPCQLWICKSSSCQFSSKRISVGQTLEAPILRRQKWKDAVLGCQINAQTVEASGWRSETVQWWIDQGAEWSETTLEATR